MPLETDPTAAIPDPGLERLRESENAYLKSLSMCEFVLMPSVHSTRDEIREAEEMKRDLSVKIREVQTKILERFAAMSIPSIGAHQPVAESVRETILRQINGLKCQEEEATVPPTHLAGFWEQLQTHEKTQILLKRIGELSGFETYHARFAGKTFEDGLVGLKDIELVSLRQALDWVLREGVMERFHLEALIPDEDARIIDALEYRLTMRRELLGKCERDRESILVLMTLQSLKGFPFFEPGGLYDYLNNSGFFLNKPVNPELRELDTFAANVSVLRTALESGIITRFQSNSRLKIAPGRFFIYYERLPYKAYPPNTRDIAVKEA